MSFHNKFELNKAIEMISGKATTVDFTYFVGTTEYGEQYSIEVLLRNLDKIKPFVTSDGIEFRFWLTHCNYYSVFI